MIGSHQIGGAAFSENAQMVAEDRAYATNIIANALDTFEPTEIVHMARNTPFEKLLSHIALSKGWENVTVPPAQLPQVVSTVEGCIVFVKVGASHQIKAMADAMDEAGVTTVEFTV